MSDRSSGDLRVWLKVGRCAHRTSRRFGEMIAPAELTPAQFDVLANLLRHPDETQQELAARLFVTKGNVTGLLHRLEERGLVERRADPHDLRVNRLRLTRAGRALARHGLEIRARLVEETMGALTEPERDQLEALLDRMNTREQDGD